MSKTQRYELRGHVLYAQWVANHHVKNIDLDLASFSEMHFLFSLRQKNPNSDINQGFYWFTEETSPEKTLELDRSILEEAGRTVPGRMPVARGGGGDTLVYMSPKAVEFSEFDFPEEYIRAKLYVTGGGKSGTPVFAKLSHSFGGVFREFSFKMYDTAGKG